MLKHLKFKVIIIKTTITTTTITTTLLRLTKGLLIEGLLLFQSKVDGDLSHDTHTHTQALICLRGSAL